MAQIKNFLVILFSSLVMLFLIDGCHNNSETEQNTFSFVFMTDIHLQPELNAVEGFQQAMDAVNELTPDFVITGGDLIMDALGQTYGKSDSLYNLYQKEIKRLKMPVYNTMGNHEIYGIYSRSGASPEHEEYGEEMFHKRLGDSYYSFEHKGWKFMILNSVEDTKKGKYIGQIDHEQMEWIKKELAQTNKETPLVLSTHIPFITAFKQKYAGSTLPNDSNLVVVNSKEVIDLFEQHNLKIVLQGHLHMVEDICIDDIHFVTGGAISASWWRGPNKGYEEGFLRLTAESNGEFFEWEYIDYDWEVSGR